MTDAMTLARLRELVPVLPEGWKWTECEHAWSGAGSLLLHHGDDSYDAADLDDDVIAHLGYAMLCDMWDEIVTTSEDPEKPGQFCLSLVGWRDDPIMYYTAPTKFEALATAYTAWRKAKEAGDD